MRKDEIIKDINSMCLYTDILNDDHEVCSSAPTERVIDTAIKIVEKIREDFFEHFFDAEDTPNGNIFLLFTNKFDTFGINVGEECFDYYAIRQGDSDFLKSIEPVSFNEESINKLLADLNHFFDGTHN